jgi:hypothetical protein
MPTCNLSTIVHNIWLQQSNNRGACLFATTFDNYVQPFKQSSLYYVFLQGGVFTSRKSPLLQLSFQLHLDYKT